MAMQAELFAYTAPQAFPLSFRSGTERPLPESPLVLSYGAGVDSTAVLVGFKRLGIRPDMIVFSDTGGERPETYAALGVMDEWLVKQGWPKITRVRYNVVTARYETLEGNCLHNDVLPSLAYGGHSCSLKWKIDAIDDFVWGVRGWQPALDALNSGKQVVRVIGYDDSGADRKRFAKMDKKAKAATAKGEWSPWANWYPLQDWGWQRDDCKQVIASETELADAFVAAIGQPYPTKSACYFCPATRVSELEDLARKHPDLALRAVVMEYRAETGKHGLRTINGLGLGKDPDAAKGTRNWNWRRHLLRRGLLPADWKQHAIDQGLLPADWDAYSERCARVRTELARVVEVEQAALAQLPQDVQDRVVSAKASELKKILAAQEALGGTTGRAWVAAVAARKKAEAAKKAMLSPDWAGRPKREACKIDARRRREARRRWREAVAVAEARSKERGLPLAAVA